MRLAALLLLTALAGTLVCAREYGPPPAPTRALTVQGSLSFCLHSSLSLPVLCWLLLPLQMTLPPNSPHVASGNPLALPAPWLISSRTLLYPL